MERVDFILSEPKAIVNGVLDNLPLDWLSLREGDGVVSHYQIIIISSLTIEATRKCVRVCTGLTFCDVAPRNKKMAVFTGLNCCCGFPDLLLAVLTGITPFLKFLCTCKLSKNVKFPFKKMSTCVEVIPSNVCVKCT